MAEKGAEISTFLQKIDDVIIFCMTSSFQIFFYFLKVFNEINILAKFQVHTIITSKVIANTLFWLFCLELLSTQLPTSHQTPLTHDQMVQMS